jgi:peptidoglycan hydrolase-like protein with peptidoglycan-binding domain
MIKNIIFSKTFNGFLFGAGLVAMALVVAGVPSSASADALFRQLDLGATGSDVSDLQTFLAKDTAIYPEGLVTGYYGQFTKAAIERFQTAQGIISQGTPETTGYGRVGPMTLSAINLRMGGVSGADIYAPSITGVSLNTTDTTATINWMTNEMARGKFYYSASPIRLSGTFDQTGISFVEPTVTGSLASFDNLARTSHSATISGLSPNTSYYYAVLAIDSRNNSSVTLPAYFQTKQ